MNYKVKVNTNVVNLSLANLSLAKNVKHSRLHEVASLLKGAILRMHLRERDKLIKKILDSS